MKKYMTLAFMGMMLVAATSCDDQLEIIPKGQTTLSTVDDLETLLNQKFMIYPGPEEISVLAGVQLKGYPSVGQQLTEKNTFNYAFLTGDESVDRANLTDGSNCENWYESIYNEMKNFNIVIAKADAASGSDQTRRRIVAEAKILRAWYHFLAVNLFAAQYDEATAASQGGIAYVDNINFSEQKVKLTLAQVYDKLLADCSDEVIADLKPGTVKTAYRFGQDFGYGVRARILFQMKRYDEALIYATKALGVNDQIEDRSTAMTAGKWVTSYDADNNYLLIHNDNSNLGDLYMTTLTPEVVAMFEYGDYVKDGIFDPQEGWSDIYNDYVFPGCLMFVGGDLRFNTWGLRAESMYYVAAECLIRTGKIAEGLAKLDAVRLKRIYDPQLYSTMENVTEQQAMELYQKCRVIEFAGTFENFFDRKRWNTEPAYRKPIVHDLEEYGSYTISPDSPLWIYPFPTKARNMNSTLTNNY